MANATRRLKYEDYVDKLPALLESVAKEHDSVELERADGQVILIETKPVTRKRDPEEVRRALRESAGALKGVDIDELKRDLRETGYQDTTNRPWLA